MEFISDADMQKLAPPDFIPDAPEFIPDASFVEEIGTGTLQGLQSAGSSFAKLGAGAAAFATGDQEGALPKVNKKIDRFFGVDKHEEMHTIPGKVAQTVANVVPYTINAPAAVVGVGTMYNDLVDQLVSQGIPLSRAREIALKENAAMLGTAAVVGVPAAKLLGKFVKPATEIGKRGVQAVGGGAGFTAGVEAQTAVHNKELQDRQDLQRTLTPDERIATFLSGGILGGMHKPLPEKQAAVKPEIERGLAPEFIPDTPDGISVGERAMLGNARKLMEDKLERINMDVSKLEREIGRTGEYTKESLEALNYLESELNRISKDLVEHDALVKGDKELAADALESRRQEIIADLKARREKPEVEASAVEKVSPVEVAVEKITEAMQEPKEKVADRILEAYDKLDAIVEKESKEPGADYSSLRESLKQEIAAYEAIQRGEKPDLSWFKGDIPPEQVVVKNKLVPTADEANALFRRANTLGEVFDIAIKRDIGTPGQKALLRLLNRSDHVRGAKFALGSAIEKNGIFSKGSYDSTIHKVELHKGGSIKTLLHESVHAATQAMLSERNSKAAKQMIALYEKYKASHGDSPNAVGKPFYGFTNIHEFVAEAFTNKAFQQLLQTIPSGEVTVTGRVLKMWDKFKEIIKTGLKADKTTRMALDEVLDAGAVLIETANSKPETFFTKLAEKHKTVRSLSLERDPTVKDLRDAVGRNIFGINTLEGFYRDNKRVQEVFKGIRSSIETADRIQNELLHNTGQLVAEGKVGFMDTLSKVRDKDSAIIALETTSGKDAAVVHELFMRGFEQELDYKKNLEVNGGHLTPDQVKVYNTFSKLFDKMYQLTVAEQKGLDKKHILPYRAGWYPAKRLGEFSVEIAYRGNNVHVQSFKTRLAAEKFRKQITDGKNLRHLEVSDVLTKDDLAGRQPNAEMAEIVGEYLASKYPKMGEQLKESIDKLVFNMQTRGGKLGYHHQHRTNVPGYLGTELFRNMEQQGNAFKDGIKSEVNNFGMNLRTLLIKTRIEPKLTDPEFRALDPNGYAAAKQMYESALGRNEDFLGTKLGAERISYAMDKTVDKIMQKALGKEFEGRTGSAYSHASNVAMRAFYATKMMAKPIFILSQILTTPMIIPEMARNGHGVQAFYSFGKAMTKLMIGDKELWNHLKEMSQQYNVTESQFLESMNLDKHASGVSKTEKIGNVIEDYVLMGKPGKAADSLSRLLSYAASYTHFTDLGFAKFEAARLARLATDKAMNTYDSASSAPIFDKLGVIGQGMKPLTSFGLNQLGNFLTYVKAAGKGDFAPLTAYALVATAMGGVMSLPFIQEYERMRLVLEKLFDVSMPSILEIFSGDESFLDRLNVTSQDAKDVAVYGLPALTGIDLTSSMRSNETLVAIAAAVALGQEDAKKLFPIIGATVDTVAAIPEVGKSILGKSSVAETRKAVDSVISGPIGYAAKEALGANTTKVFGQDTGMISTGTKGDADIPRTKTDVVAGLLGGRSIEQRRLDTMTHELNAREKMRKQKIDKNLNMLVETGDMRYIKKLTDLGVTGEQLESGIASGIYNKNVGQYIRFFVNASGAVDERKAGLISNFGIKK